MIRALPYFDLRGQAQLALGPTSFDPVGAVALNFSWDFSLTQIQVVQTLKFKGILFELCSWVKIPLLAILKCISAG
jgi:hypothetical protein